MLWHEIRESRPLDEIASSFSLRYSIPLETAIADINAAIHAWSSTILSPQHQASADVPPAPVIAPASDPLFVGHYALNNRVFRIEIFEEDLIEEIAPRLHPLRADASDSHVLIQLFRDAGVIHLISNGDPIALEPTPSAARSLLLQEMTRVSEPGRDWLAVLHAGACGTQSECVLLAAPSHSGKSTLVAALMRAGLVFYSDDSAPIERTTLKIAAMPFALMLREGSWAVLQSRYPELCHAPLFGRTDGDVRFLPPVVTHAHGSLAKAKALVFPAYIPEAATQLERIDFLECLVNLQESKFWVAHDPDSIQAFLSLIHSLPAYRLTYSELDEAVLAIDSVLATNSP